MEEVIIWRANTALRKAIKPNGGVVRIAMGDEALNGLLEQKPSSYLSELIELKDDLFNQIGYAILDNGLYAVTCSRMYKTGYRNTAFLCSVKKGMLIVEAYETKETECDIVQGVNWRSIKKDGRK